MDKELNDIFNYPIKVITWRMWFILLFVQTKYIKADGFNDTVDIMKYKVYKNKLYIIDIFSIKKNVDSKMH